MLFKKRDKEAIIKKKLVNLYNKLFAEMFSENQEKDGKKVYVDFSENRIDIGIIINREIDEQYDEHISSVLDEWSPTIDKKLTLVVIGASGIIFEYSEDINNVDVDYISELVNKVIKKYDEIIENLT